MKKLFLFVIISFFSFVWFSSVKAETIPSINVPYLWYTVASSTLDNYDAWKIFDKWPNNNTSIWHAQYPQTTDPQRVSITLPYSIKIWKYEITAWQYSKPINRQLQASNNWSSWVDLDIQTWQSFMNYEKKSYTFTPLSTLYSKYRIYVTDTTESDYVVDLAELQLFPVSRQNWSNLDIWLIPTLSANIDNVWSQIIIFSWEFIVAYSWDDQIISCESTDNIDALIYYNTNETLSTSGLVVLDDTFQYTLSYPWWVPTFLPEITGNNITYNWLPVDYIWNDIVISWNYNVFVTWWVLYIQDFFNTWSSFTWYVPMLNLWSWEVESFTWNMFAWFYQQAQWFVLANFKTFFIVMLISLLVIFFYRSLFTKKRY